MGLLESLYSTSSSLLPATFFSPSPIRVMPKRKRATLPSSAMRLDKSTVPTLLSLLCSLQGCEARGFDRFALHHKEEMLNLSYCDCKICVKTNALWISPKPPQRKTENSGFLAPVGVYLARGRHTVGRTQPETIQTEETYYEYPDKHLPGHRPTHGGGTFTSAWWAPPDGGSPPSSSGSWRPWSSPTSTTSSAASGPGMSCPRAAPAAR